MLRPTKWFGWSRSSSVENVRSTQNPHSLEQLKVLYRLLEKNQKVNENNRTLLVETLRQIAEILIWGDQNDSSVFDFFLEKNMLYFFLKIMKQKCGGYVCTQLLQTLNILFENIKNETSLYYLLSNNHVNSIIIHKFDFSDEEVMAYYISFLKTLSLKLNPHTIHFFFNEHTADFPLYTEAIKFFNHPEKMVRIAVRTLTLNVFKVQESAMLRFIRDCTAAPYFSNLSWFIGNHVLDLDNSATNYIAARRRKNSNSESIPLSSILINRLEDLVAEHLDHLHYLNDILLLNIDDLNNVLSDNLLYRLVIPLYIHSVLSVDLKFKTKFLNLRQNTQLSPNTAIFLLTQFFLIISYGTILNTLILTLFSNKNDIEMTARKCEFSQPLTSLEDAIEQAIQTSNSNQNSTNSSIEEPIPLDLSIKKTNTSSITSDISENVLEKVPENSESITEQIAPEIEWQNSPFLVHILASLNSTIYNVACGTSPKDAEKNSIHKSCHSPQVLKLIPDWTSSDDRAMLFSLSLITSIITNQSIESRVYENIFAPGSNETKQKSLYSFFNTLLNSLLLIMRQCSSPNSQIRLVTFELAIHLFRQLTNCCNINCENFQNKNESGNIQSNFRFSDHQIALLEQAREDACHILRKFYCSIDKTLFLNLFEKEAKILANSSNNPNIKSNIWSHDSNLTLEQHFMDASLLLPLNDISLEDSNFHLRLPEMDYEKARYIIQVFLALRLLSLDIRKMMNDHVDDQIEKAQDLSIILNDPSTSLIAIDKFIDLENCELNSCSVSFHTFINQQRSGDRNDRYSRSAPSSRSDSPLSAFHKKRMPRFMAIVSELLILIEPDDKRYGWGVVRFIARLQDTAIHSRESIAHLHQHSNVWPNFITTIPPLPEKDDIKSLYIYFSQYQMSATLSTGLPSSTYTRNSRKSLDESIVAHLQFNDAVRSLVARNNLNKASKKVLNRKIQALANLIDLPATTSASSEASQVLNTGSEISKTNKSDRNHSMVNRTHVVPGVAVPSRMSQDQSNTSIVKNQQSIHNKKRYAYPPASYVVGNSNNNNMVKTKSAPINIAKTSMENDRKRKKKSKFHSNVDEIGGEYAIPLNDLSPKTIKKNVSNENNEVIADSSASNFVEEVEEAIPGKINEMVIGNSLPSNGNTKKRSETFDI